MDQQPTQPEGQDQVDPLEVDEVVEAELVGEEQDDLESPADEVPSAEGDDQLADAESTAEQAAEVEQEPDWKDLYIRSVAELENVRKRSRRDAIAGERRGVIRLVKELLPAVDNLERAVQHAGEAGAADSQILEGVKLVQREILNAFEQAGIESFDPVGDQFDPRFHEALSQQPPSDGILAGTVAMTYQSGYKLGDEIVRPAKVVVAG